MRRCQRVLLLIISIFIFFFLAGPAQAELKVVTTTEDIAALVKEVAGGLVKVDYLARGDQDPHYIQAKPSHMVKLNRADLLIYQGLELEVGWLPLLIEGARNPKVRAGQPGHLDLSQAIVPLDIPKGEVDRSMGDIHPLGNPHYHLDPVNGLSAARFIADRLIALSPELEPGIKTNLERFTKTLEAKIIEWKEKLSPFQQALVVTYHTTWSYFLNRFNIRSIGTIELKPGIPPSPRRLAHLAETMKRQNVTVILQANSIDHTQALARQTGSTILILPASVGGKEGIEDYISLFDYLVSQIQQTLGKTS